MKTPSIGIDQSTKDNSVSEGYVDKYLGRVPQFLREIPEAFICEVNPEYIRLMDNYMNGRVNPENISDELKYEIENIIVNYDCPCLLSSSERVIINALLFYQLNGDLNSFVGCPPPVDYLVCADLICCNAVLLCKADTVCTA